METTTKKKVLFFVPTFPVLTETFILGEIKKLAERGNLDIRVLSLDGDKERLPDVLKDKVIYKRLTLFSAVAGLFFGLGKIKKCRSVIKKISGKKISFSKKIFNRIKYLGYARIISSMKPDLIVAHFLSEPSTIAMAAAMMVDKPFGISAHAKDVTVTSEYVKEKLENSRFILICNKNAYRFLTYGLPEEVSKKVILQYHGVDVSNIADGVTADEKNKAPSIVSVGRLTEKKGHVYLIEASAILKKRGIAHQIYIIGPGPLHESLKEKIRQLDVVDTVKIMGEGEGLPFPETLKYIKSARVGVFTGIRTDEGDEDGVPNVVLEYAAAGIPIVSTDAGSTTDFIENEKTGLLVPQKNSRLLADAIERLIFDENLRVVVTENAKSSVNKNFNIDVNVVELEKILLSA